MSNILYYIIVELDFEAYLCSFINCKPNCLTDKSQNSDFLTEILTIF